MSVCLRGGQLVMGEGVCRMKVGKKKGVRRAMWGNLSKGRCLMGGKVKGQVWGRHLPPPWAREGQR